MRAHRRRAAVARGAEAAAREAAERAGERAERHRERPHAAAVGGLLARPLDAAGLGDAVAHRALERMADAEVPVERPALLDAAGEAERVLARAVVADPRGGVAGRSRGSSGSSGPQPSAPSTRPVASSTSATTPTCAAEPPWEAQASARWRVPSPKCSSDARADAPQRLQRLHRGAGEHGQAAVGPLLRTAGTDHAPRDAVLRLLGAAPERDDPRQERDSCQRCRLSRTIRSASSRSYQPSTTTSLPSGCL